jgi:tRNA A-37 threonylcarbamoyl transferase component Bud32
MADVPVAGVEVAGHETVDPSHEWTHRRTRRQRRPTGAPPPLPRTIAWTTRLWVTVAVAMVVASIASSSVPALLRSSDLAGTSVLRTFARARTPWLNDVAQGIKVAGSRWGVTAVSAAGFIALMVLRRWRHVLVFLGSIVALQIVGAPLYEALSRPRPYGVRIISGWGGYSSLSPPVANLAILLVGFTYTLFVAGQPRQWAKVAVAALLAVFILARLYLGVDHPDDALLGAALGIAIPVAAFRYFTPNHIFPVRYRRGRAAHLDVTGRRGDAIIQATHDQLGLTVLEIQPVGLEASGGSTPLRLHIEGSEEVAADDYVFAKLYANGHVRADRWYKIWRTILYGGLEDEDRHVSVRRLVEYEDYMLRLFADVGIPSAKPLGIVEITPEREYLLVTEFFAGSVELGKAEIDDGIIDQGLAIVRKLWDAGLAHRDIKPANLLVREGELLLIDDAFSQVRPSPWRQAVDLGNMLLVLAVRSDAERVYQRALTYFSPDEISEAFAATRGVASPSQLRSFLKQRPGDLLAEFRALAPPRKAIRLQRWSFRRCFLAAGLLLAIFLGVYSGAQSWFPAENIGVQDPGCGTNHTMILMAQAVPSAEFLPCIASLPTGWSIRAHNIQAGVASLRLGSDLAGPAAATITLRESCDSSQGAQVPSDKVGTTRFEQQLSLTPKFLALRYYRFAGGCITYRFDFSPGASPLLTFQVDNAISFMARSTLVHHVQQTEGLALCGRGAPCAG